MLVSVDDLKIENGMLMVAGLVGIGLSVKKHNNVIIRNLKISKVKADSGDAIGIQYANNVWGMFIRIF